MIVAHITAEKTLFNPLLLCFWSETNLGTLNMPKDALTRALCTLHLVLQTSPKFSRPLKPV